MTDPRNPFRDRQMRQAYGAAIIVYRRRHRDLFLPQTGERRRAGCYGSSFAQEFWRGYDGIHADKYRDRASRQTLGYAFWCAGRDLAKKEPLPATPS